MTDLTFHIETARCQICGKPLNLSGRLVISEGRVVEAAHDECERFAIVNEDTAPKSGLSFWGKLE